MTPKEVAAAEEEPGWLEWFRPGEQTGVGFVDGNTFRNKPVQYSAINGLAVFEGDIILGTVEEIEARAAQPPTEEGEKGLIIPGMRYRWPGGYVPWVAVAPLRQRVLDAIAHWQSKTHLLFVERTAANASQWPNYISFEERDGCWSYVGMQRRGKQVISLAAGCGFSAAVHEIGHAIGLWHEQSREDRDQHVQIVWANIIDGQRHNFEQHITDGDDVGSYDFDSIMHYGPTAFSKNGQRTLVPLGGQEIGPRKELSDGDVAAVAAMYPQLEPSRSWHGVQFTATLASGQTKRWVTHSWPSYWNVAWTVVPIEPVEDESAQIEWKVQATRQADTLVKYFLKVRNLTSSQVTFQARYTVLGWSRDAL